jgi:YD repeat-containing protein
MRCPRCNSDLPPEQPVCPHCGTLATRRSFGARRPLLLIGICLFVLGLTVVGVYLFLSGEFMLGWRSFHQPRAPREVPVEHGSIVRPDELQPHGKLFFVPMGKQAIPAQELADYYNEKFHIKITVLPELALEDSACVPSRHQCIAEEMMIDTERAYQPAGTSDTVVIILTDEDIYPRSLDWNFTYSYHSGYRIGIVSTHRMDPAYWGDPPNPDVRLANTKQMLTKYVALLYFHVPRSSDPSSLMYQPLTPNGGPDDLFESDLHSEESANGLRGSGWPCLYSTYSYETGELKPYTLSPTDCEYLPETQSPSVEGFATELGIGQFVDKSMDLQLDSSPGLAFRRAYLSQDAHQRTFGFGANHNYNTWLYSDGAQNLTFMDIIHEDGSRDHLDRLTPGRGFSSDVVFESHDDGEEIYGARMTWDQGHFKLQYRDGSWSTYLPCADGRCYWIGHRDAQGNALTFERAANLDLRRVTAQDQQGIEFDYDAQHRIKAALDTRGNRVAYEYEPDGCLSKVRRANGQTTLYAYDSGHRMTSISVVRAAGESPRVLVTNKYNSAGQLTDQLWANGTSYHMKYGPPVQGHPAWLELQESSERVLYITFTSNSYREQTTPVKYPAKVASQ